MAIINIVKCLNTMNDIVQKLSHVSRTYERMYSQVPQYHTGEQKVNQFILHFQIFWLSSLRLFQEVWFHWKKKYFLPSVNVMSYVVENLVSFRGEAFRVSPIRPLILWFHILLNLTKSPGGFKFIRFLRWSEECTLGF